MEELSAMQPIHPLLVARRLTAIRAALGLNKADFADSLEIDRSSYTKIEKGQKPLLPKDAYRIFERYAVDLNFIYLGQVGGLPAKLSKSITSHLTGDIS